jgi:hypothetical protein
MNVASMIFNFYTHISLHTDGPILTVLAMYIIKRLKTFAVLVAFFISTMQALDLAFSTSKVKK